MKGIGFLYLLFLSLIVALPISYRANDVVKALKTAEFPAMVMQIPSCYLNENGILSVAGGETPYKEIVSADGFVSIVFNVENKEVNSTKTPLKVELYSDTYVLSVLDQRITNRYTDTFEKGSNFNPVIHSRVVDLVLNISVYFTYVIVVAIICLKILFLSLISALLTKFMFVILGKMKTGFSNILRLNVFASTAVGLAIIIQTLLSIQLSDLILILIQLGYMVAFIKYFRKELESGGIDEFVHKYAPAGTRVRKQEDKERRDLSEYTDGLNSTSNQQARSDGQDEAAHNDYSEPEKHQDKHNNNHPGSFSA